MRERAVISHRQLISDLSFGVRVQEDGENTSVCQTDLSQAVADLDDDAFERFTEAFISSARKRTGETISSFMDSKGDGTEMKG